MAEIDQGKKIGVRWNRTRYQQIQKLGWTEHDEGTALTNGLKMASNYQQLGETYEQFLNGSVTLGELMRELNKIKRFT